MTHLLFALATAFLLASAPSLLMAEPGTQVDGSAKPDVSTPKAAITSFFKAMDAGDEAAMGRLSTGAPEVAQVYGVVVKLQKAIADFRGAMHQSFGKELEERCGASFDRYFPAPERAQYSGIQSATEKIEGAAATLTPASGQEVYHLHKEGEGWRLVLDLATLHVPPSARQTFEEAAQFYAAQTVAVLAAGQEKKSLSAFLDGIASRGADTPRHAWLVYSSAVSAGDLATLRPMLLAPPEMQELLTLQAEQTAARLRYWKALEKRFGRPEMLQKAGPEYKERVLGQQGFWVAHFFLCPIEKVDGDTATVGALEGEVTAKLQKVDGVWKIAVKTPPNYDPHNPRRAQAFATAREEIACLNGFAAEFESGKFDHSTFEDTMQEILGRSLGKDNH